MVCEEAVGPAIHTDVISLNVVAEEAVYPAIYDNGISWQLQNDVPSHVEELLKNSWWTHEDSSI